MLLACYCKYPAHSLRSKRFQSSYCAKVRAEADEPREETLATQATQPIKCITVTFNNQKANL